jgi:uncharacterized protein (TIGR03435 family)
MAGSVIAVSGCVKSQEENRHIMSYGTAVRLRPAKKAALALAGMAFLALPMAAIAAMDAQFASSPSGAASGPRFEVASIKPARSGGMPLGVRMDKAQASFGGMSLSALISYGYGVKLAQISGPEWLTTQRFDIVAKLPEGGSTARVPEMMQGLLAERFGLKLHRESKEFPVYALMAANTGIKLTPRPEDFDPRAHNDRIAIPILSLTLLLEQFVNLPVVDETGLRGQYLFPSQAIAQAMSAGTTAKGQQRAAPAGGGVPEASEPSNSAVAALLLPAGMKLEKKKANLPVLVVESMRQTPTEN